MPLLGEQDRADLLLLGSLIDAFDRFLGWLVWDSTLIPRELERDFATVLTLVSGRFSDAKRELEAIDDTESELWKRLDDAGLIGKPLRLKQRLWRKFADAAAPSEPPPASSPPAGFVGRVLGPLLKLMNSILGSLANAIPPLELAKEYKEGVELVIQDRVDQRLDPKKPLHHSMLDLQGAGK